MLVYGLEGFFANNAWKSRAVKIVLSDRVGDMRMATRQMASGRQMPDQMVSLELLHTTNVRVHIKVNPSSSIVLLSEHDPETLRVVKHCTNVLDTLKNRWYRLLRNSNMAKGTGKGCL